jgi:hypothetical protein
MPGAVLAPTLTGEARRLNAARHSYAVAEVGPLSERTEWGAVREDYSTWATLGITSLTSTHARAYRWGGLAGSQTIAAPVFRPRPVERPGSDSQGRLFGAPQRRRQPRRTSKEYYFYSTRTHMNSTKYPTPRAYPYADLVETNSQRSRGEPVRLLDTGLFEDDRYFDVFVGMRSDTEDILIRVTALIAGRGGTAPCAAAAVVPQRVASAGVNPCFAKSRRVTWRSRRHATSSATVAVRRGCAALVVHRGAKRLLGFVRHPERDGPWTASTISLFTDDLRRKFWRRARGRRALPDAIGAGQLAVFRLRLSEPGAQGPAIRSRFDQIAVAPARPTSSAFHYSVISRCGRRKCRAAGPGVMLWAAVRTASI